MQTRHTSLQSQTPNDLVENFKASGPLERTSHHQPGPSQSCSPCRWSGWGVLTPAGFETLLFSQCVAALETTFPSGQESRALWWRCPGTPASDRPASRQVQAGGCVEATGRAGLGTPGPVFREKPIHLSLTEPIPAMLELLFSPYLHRYYY